MGNSPSAGKSKSLSQFSRGAEKESKNIIFTGNTIKRQILGMVAFFVNTFHLAFQQNSFHSKNMWALVEKFD